MLKHAQEIVGLADPLARHVDLGSIEDVPHVEELHAIPAGGYVLVTNKVTTAATEEKALHWLSTHGFEYIHLDIMLARVSNLSTTHLPPDE